MNLDFLEIGTSNFETLIQTCRDEELGMSVEPLLFYLNELPDRKNVKKIHAAITHNKNSETIQIFYIPPNIVDQHGLPQWFKGCNKIDDYHPLHIQHTVQHLVKIESVPLLNLEELMLAHNIQKIKFLKIDTEGHDAVILKGLYDFIIKKGRQHCPASIKFESNENTPKAVVEEIITMFATLGYSVVSRGHDTLLEHSYDCIKSV
jgi:FkbM family methyltransferase